VRALPGPVVNAGLETLVGALQALRLGPTDDLAKSVQAAMAVALTLGLLGLLGALCAVLGRRRATLSGALAGLGLWALLLPAGLRAGWNPGGFLWLLALGLGWGGALAWTLRAWVTLARDPQPGPHDPARRRFLLGLGAGAAALAALGLGLGRFLRRPDSPAAVLAGAPATAVPGGFVPVDGTRPELTPVPDFYVVAIKLDPPRLDPQAWRLEVGGRVQKPFALTYADFTALPAESFYATLECISNRVGGDLISTTRFTGVALREVLERAGVQPGTVDVTFACADGYSESLPLEAALDPETRLCYAMDGAPLPPDHGFPVRLFAPNRFGMKNPKWITRIEAVADDYLGFWEQRRWSDAAWVKLTAVIDAAQPAGPATKGVPPGRLEVGGVAYAGDRGVGKVEVRVDEAEWVEAEVKPALSKHTWVLWRARIAAGPGQHQVTVRTVDGAGNVQTARASDVFPDGAAGYHKITAGVE
jgi:DMSO/TMAO reductase YedYZ molybdopterin-dependent catalytic subunit